MKLIIEIEFDSEVPDAPKVPEDALHEIASHVAEAATNAAAQALMDTRGIDAYIGTSHRVAAR